MIHGGELLASRYGCFIFEKIVTDNVRILWCMGVKKSGLLWEETHFLSLPGMEWILRGMLLVAQSWKWGSVVTTGWISKGGLRRWCERQEALLPTDHTVHGVCSLFSKWVWNCSCPRKSDACVKLATQFFFISEFKYSCSYTFTVCRFSCL
jgi:hypothetical protein